jgi:hypothetical protein
MELSQSEGIINALLNFGQHEPERDAHTASFSQDGMFTDGIAIPSTRFLGTQLESQQQASYYGPAPIGPVSIPLRISQSRTIPDGVSIGTLNCPYDTLSSSGIHASDVDKTNTPVQHLSEVILDPRYGTEATEWVGTVPTHHAFSRMDCHNCIPTFGLPPPILQTSVGPANKQPFIPWLTSFPCSYNIGGMALPHASYALTSVPPIGAHFHFSEIQNFTAIPTPSELLSLETTNPTEIGDRDVSGRCLAIQAEGMLCHKNKTKRLAGWRTRGGKKQNKAIKLSEKKGDNDQSRMLSVVLGLEPTDP